MLPVFRLDGTQIGKLFRVNSKLLNSLQGCENPHLHI